jgi:hypothetical protein
MDSRSIENAFAREQVLEAIIIEAVKSGIIPRAVMERVVDRLTREAEGCVSGRTYEIALYAQCLLANLDGQNRSEYEADYRRRQMRERTAYFERRAKTKSDGGNDEA